MSRRSLLLPVLIGLCLPACVKRIPARAGGDRQIVAGEPLQLGQPLEVPEGVRVEWQLGDGGSADGPQVSHTWHWPGDYQIAVTVTDPDGEQRQDTAAIAVQRPPLLQVIPAAAAMLLVLAQPGERLAEVPLFVERLFAAGQDANELLANVREAIGFDPFRPDGWRAAGVDPGGGLAAVDLSPWAAEAEQGASALLLVASLQPGPAARKSLLRLLGRIGLIETRPSESDPAIHIVHQVEPPRVVAAFTAFRGHLWIDSNARHRQRPEALLARLRRAGPEPGIAAEPSFVRAAALRDEPGALQLYVAPGEWDRIQRDGNATAPSAVPQAFLDAMTFLRADVDVEPDRLRLQLRLGLQGESAAGLARKLRARIPVPPFRSRLPAGRHLVLKLSADWLGLLRSAAELADGGAAWSELQAGLTAFKQRTGVDLRQRLLANAGDSLALALRLRLGVLLGLAGGDRGAGSWRDAVDGVLLLQLRDAAAFFDAVAVLSRWAEQSGLGLRQVGDGRSRHWLLGSGPASLVLLPAPDMALLAPSLEAAAAVRDRRAAEASRERWPAELEQPTHQVLAVDLATLTEDLERTAAPPGQSSVALVRGMILMGLARFGALDRLVVDAVAQPRAAQIELRLRLR
jgi:hypothetical protein